MRYLFVLLLLSMQYAQAQQSLLINSYGTYNSTGVRRQVADAFFYGGLIDSSQINYSLDQLHARNTFGLQMGLNAQWQSPWMVSKDQKKWGSSYRWVFGAGVHQYAGLQFSKDLFGLVFRGGLPYTGDTLDLSNLRAQATTFSKLGFGFYNPTTHSSFLVHFVAVQQHLGATVQKGNWFQDPSTAQINLDLIGQASLSSFSSNTYGVAIDIDYRFGASDSSANEPQFQLSIQNLGFARCAQSSTYSLDGSLSYAGYKLSEWQQTNLHALASAYLDSLGLEQTTGPNWILLPAQIQLAKTLDWDSPQRLEAYYGAQFMLRQTYTPLVYVGAELKVKKAWHTGVGMAYGGFGGLRVQAYSAFRFKHSELLLRSDNIALQNGASIYLQYRCDF
jgi:hypothetical protein